MVVFKIVGIDPTCGSDDSAAINQFFDSVIIIVIRIVFVIVIAIVIIIVIAFLLIVVIIIIYLFLVVYLCFIEEQLNFEI